MTEEIISFNEIPFQCKAARQHVAIYHAAKKLLTLGPDRAIKLHLDGAEAHHAAKKAHVYYRHRPYRLKTRHIEGCLYMWIETREAARFDVVGIPLKKKAAIA
jgi:hypothetical protein